MFASSWWISTCVIELSANAAVEHRSSCTRGDRAAGVLRMHPVAELEAADADAFHQADAAEQLRARRSRIAYSKRTARRQPSSLSAMKRAATALSWFCAHAIQGRRCSSEAAVASTRSCASLRRQRCSVSWPDRDALGRSARVRSHAPQGTHTSARARLARGSCRGALRRRRARGRRAASARAGRARTDGLERRRSTVRSFHDAVWCRVDGGRAADVQLDAAGQLDPRGRRSALRERARVQRRFRPARGSRRAAARNCFAEGP